ncbi:MAG TPA: flagellar assembly peptidoglycan hydrolase FlgJ [Steroidobacteraceae bacterium]|jgi:flagellar protein FlgJ|nr:flagellar assembly peptidoglycan hydrolase FlgJ [Steroidobacteraceae bacterium]
MASGVVNPDFYADFGALTTLGKQAKQNDPQAIREAARQFESLFTDMMLKSMRAAKLGDGLGDSQEGDFYQDMYDQQLAVQMSQGKGLGLAEMLVQQLTRRGQTADQAGATGSGATGSSATAASGTVVDANAKLNVGRQAFQRATRSFSVTGNSARSAVGSKSTQGHTGHTKASSGRSGGATSLSQRIGFVQQLAPYAQRAATALGVSADTLIAQAALETGWGRHVVKGTSASDSSHNLFGLKAGTAWQGATASATTTEYTGGNAQRFTQSFRSYASVQQGVSDYVSLLKSRAAYHAALGSGTDAGAFGTALQRAGYATDPDYARKLVATAATVRSLRSLSAVAQTASPAASPGASSAAAQPTTLTVAAALAASLKVLAGLPIPNGEEPA